ncbi:MAG TPA: prepilin-type N-terminal cleavage/methylation domain-containing protein [bacterium]|nr:prepilin-type N-terminal cleavage/methylation domain-containing protein [bacterium]
MRTYPATPCRRGPLPAGFTLLEVLVVLALLGLVLLIAVPAFQTLLQGAAQREVTRLTQVVRALRNEAILGRQAYRLVFSLGEGSYAVELRAPDGRFIPVERPTLLARHKLPGSFKLQDVVVLGQTYTPLNDRPAPVNLDESGFVDPFTIHFSVDGDPYTLKVAGFTADMSLLHGTIRD